jgi:hypothetical protein
VSQASADSSPGTSPVPGTAATAGAGQSSVDEVLASLAGLEEQPVADHVAVFEAEHDRLQRELSTIDRL